MACDRVLISISDDLPEPLRFCPGCCRVSGCPGLENTLGGIEILLVPRDRKDFDSPVCLSELVPKLPVG